MLRRLRRTLKRPTVFRLALTAICAELPLPTLTGHSRSRPRTPQLGGQRAFGVAGSGYPYALKTPKFL
jgi:hypothetical protein